MNPTTRLFCGLNLTHDGGVALVEVTGGEPRLLGAIECEKVAEGARHAGLADLYECVGLLADLGCSPAYVDSFVVDGWGADAVRDGIALRTAKRSVRIRTAPYRISDDAAPPLHEYRPEGDLVIGVERPYISFRHDTSHVAAAYLTSPAAQAGLPSFVLVWDGGICPELFHVDPDSCTFEYVGNLMNLSGGLYSGFSSTVEPFLPNPQWTPAEVEAHHLSVPGKVMAYAGLGDIHDELATVMSDALLAAEREHDPVAAFTTVVHGWPGSRQIDGPSILATFEHCVGELLIHRLRSVIERMGRPTGDLALTGGCALNIKWNSAIRRSGVASRIWVPPFPNDSGAALGAAGAAVMAGGGFGPIKWSVYQGPALQPSSSVVGWTARPCAPCELGALLADLEVPVVVLIGAAELGPRALGHRSILASPKTIVMRDRLNEIKRREQYRPVAPLCLVERATDVFAPGGEDRYMLFDHQVRPDWADRIPAVVHADGSARIQTISCHDEPILYEIVAAFAQRSGLPVVCNTSANRPGRGFFPSVAAAMDWGGVDHIWAEQTLYTKSIASRDVH